MHKLRNTIHKKALESLVGTIAPGCSTPLSKRVLRYLLCHHGWDVDEVRRIIERDEWWCPFCDD